MEEWNLKLNKYQRDNLLMLINVCGYPQKSTGNTHAIEPFTVMDNGDWIGEIAYMLQDKDGKDVIDLDKDDPNDTPDEIRENVSSWVRNQMR